MRRVVATALGIIALMHASVAAASPPVCTIGTTTIYGLEEAARAVERREQPAPSDPFSLKTIVLDPGHGGSNEGAVGIAARQEKYLTLDLAYELRAELERRHPGVRVLLTRYWDRDVELPERIRWANAVGADLFVSLHYNAATHDRALGYETYFLSTDVLDETAELGDRYRQPGTRQQKRARRAIDKARVKAHLVAQEPLREPHAKSQLLAATVQAELAARLEGPDRGVKSANFAVLRGALMPAVVVESGFLTHPQEGLSVLRKDHRRRVVESLAAAIDIFEASQRPRKAVESVAASKPASAKQPQKK